MLISILPAHLVQSVPPSIPCDSDPPHQLEFEQYLVQGPSLHVRHLAGQPKNYWNIYFNKKCDKILLWFNENTF